MRFFLLVLPLLALGSPIAVGKGHARVDWIAMSKSCPPGKPVQTAVRMAIDPGWHTYWINPGEGGMKTTFEWKLPDGWKVGELGSPLPERFLTGDLPGFGYEGTVLFPLLLTPPADFSGTATLSGTVSWLACNDGACVPGESEVTVQLSAGQLAPTGEAGLIETALAKVPSAADANYKLHVADDGNFLKIRIEASSGKTVEFPFTHAFPATPDVIDAGAEIRFATDGGGWSARVPKSEYATQPIEKLVLVFAGPESVSPISLTWQKSH
jgi:thiol:disulfide interchange protein DsbD